MSLLLVALGGAAWYILDYLFAPKHSVNEPPLVSQSIPYIGHLLGLLRYGTHYYEMKWYSSSSRCDQEFGSSADRIFSTQFNFPIFTLNMLNVKVYVTRSPELVNAINRNSSKLAFNPFIAHLGKRITGHDEATSQIVQHSLNGENGTGYVIDIHDRIVKALAPGDGLVSMTSTMLQESFTHFAALDAKSDNEIDLFEWTREVMTICSSRAIYGPENPFSKNPDLVPAFWFVLGLHHLNQPY